MKAFFLYVIFYLCTLTVVAQVTDSIGPVLNEEFLYLIDGDSVAVESIALNEIIILDKIEFDSKQEYKKYLILKKKTRRVYPYAKMAADTLIKLVVDLQDIKKKRHRKKYIKNMQHFMEDRFTPELKKLTRTEGQILVKLIYRQTGITMYDLIKEYRNGFKAFIYDRTAHLFSISLKKKFDPLNVYEDYLIEDILQRSFQDGVLERQPSSVKHSFYDLLDKWDGHKPVYEK